MVKNTNVKQTILFLYTEIAEYFLAGIQALSKTKTEIHIVKWATNKEAPFKFREIKNVNFYERNDFSKKQLLKLSKNINPDIIIISGWIDKSYLKIASLFKNKIPTVLTLDNHWEGGLKQKIASLLSPFFLKNKFSHAWVPGKPQKKYALKLGFAENKISTGFYSADTQLFSKYYKQYQAKKQKYFPKKLLYVGRYIPAKAVNLLWSAFIELQEEEPNDWELICVGTGELFDQRIKHPKIKHLGFVQPTDIGKIISETGIFILPSSFEPWGVVVHEYAAAGFPLICSDKIASAATFLEENKNGFLFESDNKTDLKKSVKKIMNLPTQKLIEMGKISREKSLKLSHDKWADTVLKILQEK